MNGLLIEAKVALRNLARTPATLIAAALSLTLGLGANATMLRVLDQLFFRPPALVSEPEAVRRLYFSFMVPSQGYGLSGSTSYLDFADLRRTKTLSHIAAYVQADIPVGTGDAVRKAKATLLSGNFFDLLKVSPLKGRTFSPAENQGTYGSFVALISEDLWKEYYGERPDVLGQPLRVGNDLYTIVGVMPGIFTGVELEAVDIWLPLHAIEKILGPSWHRSRGSSFLDVIGRLRPDISSEMAEKELTTLYRLAHSNAGEPRPEARVLLGPVQRAWGPGAQRIARVSIWLAAVSFAVLLIACVNIANLLLIRSLERRRELAIRLALGATKGRLVSTGLFESFFLATLGGLGALLIMYFAGSSFREFLLPGVALEGFLDFRTIGLLMAVMLVAGLGCGAAPAIWESRRTPFVAMKSPAGGGTTIQAKTRWSLVAAQVALALILLVGSGLFVRSLHNVHELNLGLDHDRILIAALNLQNSGYTPVQAQDLYLRALERTRQIPGVEGASLAATIPLVTSMVLPLTVPEREALPRLPAGGPYVNGVSEGFFSTLGTAVRRGRAFTQEDRQGSIPVALVNETFARLVWPDRDAIGQCLIVGTPPNPCSIVVGVVEDIPRAQIQEPAALQVYIPLAQAPTSLTPQALLLRVKGDPNRWVGIIRSEFQTLAPSLPWIDVFSLADLVNSQVQPWTLGATVLSIFGSLALILAAVGLYASISFALVRRQHEMGIRLALGARRGDLLRHGLSEPARFVLVGAALGLACVLIFGDLVEPLLLNVRVTDLSVLIGATLALVITAAMAGYLPTRRLRRVDPAEVLRPE